MIEIGRLGIEFREQWSQFLDDCNWYDFDIVRLFFENEPIMGDFEVVAMLLGFGVRIVWVYDNHAEVREEIRERLKEIEEGYYDNVAGLGPEAAPPDGGEH